MQRPRRTCEFSEDTVGTAKRQSSRQRNVSITAPSPCPGTAQKFAPRHSRIARPSTMDGSRLTVDTASMSAMRQRTTPQKTPQRQSVQTNRVLFTGEKHRATTIGVSSVSASSTGGGALHNDKKWVQEQMQRITDHLRMVASKNGTVGGIAYEFFERPGCLKQMSIKHFIAIINYFLSQIPGNRFQIGSNHVDDIVSILQKLHYPHQVNKSSLKTPAAQHSFGNIVTLFDFLMDFVTPASEEELHFPVAEHLEHTISATLSEEQFQAPDAEFQVHLLQSAAEGFKYWDTSTQDEYAKIQQDTCEKLIIKRCGVTSSSALAVEIQKLENHLNELEKRRPPERIEDEQQCRKLRDNIKCKLQQLQMYRDDYETDSKEVKQLDLRRHALEEKVTQLREEIDQTQERIRKQMCSADQRYAMIEEIGQLKEILQVQKRTVHDVQYQKNHQEVFLSRTKKDVTANVEAFNKHMREISYSQLANTENLQLPLNPQCEHMQRILAYLAKLTQTTEGSIQQLRQDDDKLNDQIQQIADDLEIRIQPAMKKLELSLHVFHETAQRLELFIKKERDHLDGNLIAADVDLQKTHSEIEKFTLLVDAKRLQLQKLKEENEATMSRAEGEYQQAADARERELKKCMEVLEQGKANLDQLKEIINSNTEEMKKVCNKYGKEK